MMRLWLSALLLLGVNGCQKADPPTPRDHKLVVGEGMADLAALESARAEDDYVPTASEVPLTEDFAAAAAKRVTPESYRQELVVIEKELNQLEPRRQQTAR